MNPRVVKEATALQEAGHAVHVIATKLVDFVEPRDLDIMNRASWKVQRVDFTSLSVRRTERLLQEGAKRVWPVIRGAATQASSPLARRLKRAVDALPADLYIAHYPPALPAAASAAKRWNVRYAYDAEDFHLGDLPEATEHAPAKAVIREIEGRYLPGAAYVTAASPGIADAYAKEYSIQRPQVVLNAFPIPAVHKAPSPIGTARGPSVYWFSQTIGPDRGLEAALEAIARAKTRPHLYLRGTAQRGYARTIEARAHELGCDDRLHLLPPGLPSEMEALAAAYDVGLVGETGDTQNRRIALTNKQVTYLLAGLPALMSDIPAHAEFAKEAEGAVFLFRTGDPDDMARRMDALLGDPEKLAAARVRAFALGRERFNWETEAPKLVSIVEEATAR
ncbi:MAG: glycosyltransferase [Pseudomonadota bacterium]